MASFEGVHLLIAAASQLHGGKRLARRTVDYRPVRCKDGAVAGAIPSAIGVVPGHRAALVRAGCGNGVERPFNIPTHRDLLVTPEHHSALAPRDVVGTSDNRLAFAVLMIVLGVGPGRVVEPLPWTGPALDSVRDHHASCGSIADAPGIETSGDMETRSVVGIGFTDIRHSIRRVVVLIAQTPGNIADGQVLSRPLFQVDESCRDVPILTGVELGAQHDKQRTSVIPAGT